MLVSAGTQAPDLQASFVAAHWYLRRFQKVENSELLIGWTLLFLPFFEIPIKCAAHRLCWPHTSLFVKGMQLLDLDLCKEDCKPFHVHDPSLA
jgi:hypothetical protein